MTLRPMQEPTAMRNILLAAAIAIGLVVLWAAILPLTAQPAPSRNLQNSPAISKALFLCRTGSTIDKACVAALAKALVLDEPQQTSAHTGNRSCQPNAENLAELEQRH